MDSTSLSEGGNAVFVTGVRFSGKSHFIETQGFKNRGYAVLDISDYLERASLDDELKRLGYWERSCRVNERLLEDAAEMLSQGRSVVIEHSFSDVWRSFNNAEGRIFYADTIGKLGIPIEIYTMLPSDERLMRNCESYAENNFDDPRYIYERSHNDFRYQSAFPNTAEGFSKIYEVTDAGVNERSDEPEPERVKKAREKIDQARRERAEKLESARLHEEAVRKAEYVRFWHYCEVCGKKELLTADEAHEQGWEYPPRVYRFRYISPRICGDCSITDTLSYRKICAGVRAGFAQTESERKTAARIKNEPGSLMPTEAELMAAECTRFVTSSAEAEP